MDAQILPRFLKRSAANFVNSEFWRSLSTRTLAINEASTGCSIVAPKDIATRAHARSDAWDAPGAHQTIGPIGGAAATP